jgi:hypothetical protein
MTLQLGYVFVENYPGKQRHGDKRLPEHRLPAGINCRHHFDQLHFRFRVRYEPRWQQQITNPGEPGLPAGNFTLHHEARCQLRASYPLVRNGKHTRLEALLSEEVFLAPAALDHVPQNRLRGMLEYHAGRHWHLEAGYMLQSLGHGSSLSRHQHTGFLGVHYDLFYNDSFQQQQHHHFQHHQGIDYS